MKKFNSTSVSDLTESGFTLLEILIAITLLAFISIGVVSITENAATTKDRTTEINENNLQIETAMSRFEWDFSQIYSPLYFSTVMNLNQGANNIPGADSTDPFGGGAGGNQGSAAQPNPYLQQYYEQLVTRFERNEHFKAVSKEGHPIPRFLSPEKDTFEFFTSSNRRKIENQRQSHFAWVRYGLAPQEENPDDEDENKNIPKNLRSLVRYFSADDPYGDKRINIEDAEKVKGAILLRNVESLEFQFWDLQKRKWETSLRSIQDGESIIRGVKVSIAWYDSFGTKRTSQRIFRTHWPLAVIQDQVANPAGTTAGSQGGTAGANGGDNSGGQDQGGTSGNNGGDDGED